MERARHWGEGDEKEVVEKRKEQDIGMRVTRKR